MNPKAAQVAMLARAGYAARAIVYFSLGYLTFATGQAEGTSSVLDKLEQVPGGTALLGLLALGLAAYGLFRLYGAWVDLENDGDGWKGRGKRFAHVLSGLSHFALAWAAVRLVAGTGGSDDGSAGGAAATTVLDVPGGWLLVAAVGIGFAVAAVSQATKAWSGKFMRLMARDTPHWAEAIGRVGFAARAAVFAALAWTIIDAALDGSAGSIGFRDALASYRQYDALYAAIAIGLALFGVFSLVMARYRDVCDSPFVRRLLSH